MKKRAIESRVEQVYQIRPEHLNGAGRLFGGRLMEWIDEAAGLVGIRHSQCNVITASVDNLKFIRGVYQNDLVVLVGTLTWVGNTSKPTKVPGLLIESIGQQAEWEAGQKRKELRIQRNKEGF